VDPADVVPALDGDVGVAVDVPADVVPPVPEGVSAGPVVIGVPVVPVVLVELAAPVAPALPDGALVDVDDESVASALATPGEVATIMPNPNAAANAPTSSSAKWLASNPGALSGVDSSTNRDRRCTGEIK